MEPIKTDTHSFVIKIWLEEPKSRSAPAVWRGRVTHVASGKHFYIDQLNSIAFIISPFLREMEVDLGYGWYFKRFIYWLQSKRKGFNGSD